MSTPFYFSTEPLDSTSLRLQVRDASCGGYAEFEGWVRNHNEGQFVTLLEYEAYAELAEKEGARIVAEAKEKFGVRRAFCVHRLGSLAIGDVAVWVGVSAAHRDEAFRACRYIIDEVKHRVPIWKKEHYIDGDSGWVNCERCAAPSAHTQVRTQAQSDGHAHDHAHGHAHGHAHDQAHDHPHHHAHPHAAIPTPDYSRQIALKEVGVAGQERLAGASVLVVGAGGLGVPVLQYLAGAGVGRIGIVDGDRLEASNLHRQTWYALSDCGAEKAALAERRVRALNPQVRVDAHALRLDATNADRLVTGFDLIVDCSDNFATKFLLNDLALRTGKPVLFASVYQYEGQLQFVRGDAASPCLRCVWPAATRDGLVGNCAEAGVLGPVPGVLGGMQALEVLKLLLGLPGLGADEILLVDLTTLTTQRLRARRAADCAAHAAAARPGAPSSPVPAGADLEVDFTSLDDALNAGFTLIDVRDARELLAEPLPAPALHMPVSKLMTGASGLDAGAHYLLVCASGKRSAAAADLLRANGLRDCRSLRGGLKALKASA
jgi:sulfur-carrier protein adenylyltransferase/sulfurtransferase